MNTTTPIIMIAAGCGIAPFIGYIEEREWLLKTQKDVNYGPLELYFGCRRKTIDFIYSKQIMQWKDEEVLSGLHVAFSREEPIKIYVQDLLKGDKTHLYQLIKEKGGIVAVCGSVSLGEGINKTMLEVLGEEKSPKDTLSELEKTARYIVEVWS